MRLFTNKALALSLVVMLAVPGSVFATNGYFLIGYGAKSRSMGGVGVAYAQDGLAAATNPAGMTDAGVGTMRIDFGGELFSPPRSIRHSSETLGNPDPLTREKSGSNLFLIPSFGAIYKFNRKLYMGMAVIGNGANTRYHQDVEGFPDCVDDWTDEEGKAYSYFYNFSCHADSRNVGVQLLQMQMLPSVAYQVTKNHSIGASLAFSVQMFRAYGLAAFSNLGFAGEGSTGTSGNGNDWSYGAGVRVGWLGKFLDQRLSVGASYASRVYMSEFEKYDTLFAEHGDFDIPEHYTIGLAYKLTPKLTVAADVQRIMYSDIASVANSGPSNRQSFNENGPCGEYVAGGGSTSDEFYKSNCLLGGPYGLGFGWDDATVYKIGLNYDYNKQWSFRAGYNHADAPMAGGTLPDSQVLFNMLAPATVEDHVTVGASYRPSKNIEWSFNYMHAFENTISGETVFSNLDEGEPNGSMSMYIDSLGVSFAYNM